MELSATHAVFETPELLIQILLYLDYRQVLTLRRVSKTFATTIDSSPLLLWHTYRCSTIPRSIQSTLPIPNNPKKTCYVEVFPPFLEAFTTYDHPFEHGIPRDPSFTGWVMKAITGPAKWIRNHSTDTSDFPIYLTRPPVTSLELQIGAGRGDGANWWRDRTRNLHFADPSGLKARYLATELINLFGFAFSGRVQDDDDEEGQEGDIGGKDGYDIFMPRDVFEGSFDIKVISFVGDRRVIDPEEEEEEEEKALRAASASSSSG